MRNNLKRSAVLFLLPLSILCLTAEVLAQEGPEREARTFSRTFKWRDVVADGEVRLDLRSVPYIAGGFAPDKVTLEFLPSGRLMQLGPSDRVVVDDGPAPQLIIKMPGQAPSDLSEEQLRVTVRLSPLGAGSMPAIQQPSKQTADELAANLESLKKVQEIVRGWLAFAKLSREKHLYISPSLSGGSEVGIHPVLYSGPVLKMNRPINQIDFGLDLDKNSVTSADSNFVNLGFNFRKIIPLKRARALRVLRASQEIQAKATRLRQESFGDTQERAAQEAKLNSRLKLTLTDAEGIRQGFFRALLVTPFSPRLEMNLKALKPGPVNNFINNTEVQLRTGTRALFSKNLDWSLKLIPVGLEAGVTLRNKDNPLQKGQGIIRLNTGAVAKVALHFPCHSDIIGNRIQFEVKVINRHLFREESAYSRFTKRNDSLVHGNKYTIVADFKFVFGFVTPIPRFRRRPALTVTYKNGFFPPVYTYNNAVTVHVTLESDDNDNTSDITP